MDPRTREGLVFPRSVSWVFIIIHPYTRADAVSFSFSICTLLFTWRDEEKNLFFRLRVAFPKDILFVDQKSLLILRLYRQLPKNISSFPIKLRTITYTVNRHIKVLQHNITWNIFWKGVQILNSISTLMDWHFKWLRFPIQLF